MLIQVADITFGYPGTEIFSGVSWQVNDRARIGLVGPNGCGKSTLLRLIDGRLQPDTGQVARTRGITLAYLQQSQEFQGKSTLLDALRVPFAGLLAMRQELSDIENQLEAGGNEKLLERYGALQERYTSDGGYTLESRIRALIADLGFAEHDLERSVDTLSGGERGRLELMKALLSEPDLLLLDEPTNHLDVDATEHLEARLKSWTKAFVLVSHDRYFLRSVCDEICEVEGGDIIRFTGGYDKYVDEREARHERMHAAYTRQQDHIAKTEDFIRKNLAGQKTKQAQSRRKQLEKIERVDRPQDDMEAAGRIGLRFSVGDHSGGKEAIKTDALSVGYPGAPPLVSGLDLTIYRGDRVGIVGGNGAGKSTLMKTLLGKLEPLSGAAFRGHEVRIGYFDQKLSELDEEHSLIDEVRQVRGDFNEDVARTYLGRFRFSGDDPFRKVKGLSGGERNRLTLAKMMLRPRNLLALDEPTNHLDIPAREVLEEALAAYEGTVLVISHDRFFLDRVVTKILSLENGRAELHIGNYSDWRQRVTSTASKQAKPAPKIEKPVVATTPTAPSAFDTRQRRHQARDQQKDDARALEKKKKRFAELENKITSTESALAELNQALASNHAGDWQRLHSLVADKERAEEQLQSYMAEWEKLGEALQS